MARRTPRLFDLPADVAVGRLALRRLDDAARAADRLSGGDPEGLHDFRVAVRRLRTLLRAYREVATVPKKRRARLRDLAQTSNAARDLEVALDNLRALAQSADPAVQQLARRLADQRKQAHADTLAQVAKAWPKLDLRLREVLQKHTPACRETFGDLTTCLIEAQWLELQRLLHELRTAWRDDTAHRARLAGKRLRYLFEPLATEQPDVETAINALKAFQDDFGDYHDAWVLLGLIAEVTAAQAASSTHVPIRENRAPGGEPIAPYRVLVEDVQQRRRLLCKALRDTYVTPPARALDAVATAVAALHRRKASA